MSLTRWLNALVGFLRRFVARIVERIDSGGIRIGRLLVTPTRLFAGAPLLDPCSTNLHRDTDGIVSIEHFAGFALRLSLASEFGATGISIALRDAAMPPAWTTRPRYAVRYLRWVFAGRPISSGVDAGGCSEIRSAA